MLKGSEEKNKKEHTKKYIKRYTKYKLEQQKHNRPTFRKWLRETHSIKRKVQNK